MRLTPNEVGPIPDSWTSCAIGDVSARVTNGFVGVAAPYYTSDPNGVRYLLGTNIRPNRITSDDVTLISQDFSKRHFKSLLKKGDVLTVQSGHIGTTAVVSQDFEGANCHALIIIRLNQSLMNPFFLSQYLNSEIGQARLRGLHVGSSIPHINTSELTVFKIPLPCLTEQTRISTLLATWDGAIATIKRLIANSRKQKQAFVSKVLTGKRRLSRFCSEVPQISTPHGSIPGNWTYPLIGSIAHQISQKHSGGQVYPVLSCTKHVGLVDSLSYFKKQVFSKDLSTYKVVPDGCFVYATNHIEEGSIGYQNLYEFGLVSPMYTVFKTIPKVHDGYLYRLLKTEHFRQIFAAATNSSVDRRGSLRWSDFKKLHVPLPPIKEQLAIAELLDKTDREIALLEKKLDSFSIEKSALMQQLLTGKRRVVMPGNDEVGSA